MNVAQYLKRIDVNESVDVGIDSLSFLQNQHMLKLPFENLDVINGVRIPLDVETYYDKIIQQSRGGFCYELNGLFHWLLGELGYSTYLIACTIRTGEDEWAIEESHASQIVELDQPYLVDVGFGDSARVPLPLNGKVKEDISGSFRVIQLEDGYYHKQKQKDGEWVSSYRFLNKAKQLSEFAAVCHYVQTSPKSHFTQGRIITIATPNGRCTLTKNSLTITEDKEKHKEEIEESDIPKLLKNKFGVTMNVPK